MRCGIRFQPLSYELEEMLKQRDLAYYGDECAFSPNDIMLKQQMSCCGGYSLVWWRSNRGENVISLFSAFPFLHKNKNTTANFSFSINCFGRALKCTMISKESKFQPAEIVLMYETFLLLAPTGALVLMMVYYLYIRPLFQIFTQSLDAIDVTSVTLLVA